VQIYTTIKELEDWLRFLVPMSRRQLRRLENEWKKSLSTTTPQHQQDEEPQVFQQPVKSPFVLLNSSISSITEELEESVEEGEASEKEGNSDTLEVKNSSRVKTKPKKKKKKSKNKKKTDANNGKTWQVDSNPSEFSLSSHEEQVVEKGLPKAFWVDVPRLHSKHEIRKLFGSSVEVLQDSRNKRAVRGRSGRASALSSGSRFVSSSWTAARHKSLLVSPQEDWLGTPRDLKLTFVEEDISGNKWFRYDLEGIFDTTMNEFENIVAVGDPSLLVDFVNRYPYHVEALVRLSESYELMGEPERCVHLLERAIYILEGAWPANFKPFDGSCRLRFEQGSNYLLFVVLFRYSHALLRRGLYQTSLQVTKLLYNLDWESDPMGTLLYMDSVAILTGDYMFVVNSYESAYHVRLDLLPNYRLDYALAKFYLGHDDANRELRNAILTFPNTVLMMLETWKWEMDETYYLNILESVCTTVNNNEMLDKIYRVFVSVAESIWNRAEVRNWFLQGVMTACSSWIEEENHRDYPTTNRFDSLDCSLFSQVGVADFVHGSHSLPANLVQQPIGFAQEEVSFGDDQDEEDYPSLWTSLVENLLGFHIHHPHSDDHHDNNNNNNNNNNDSDHPQE
jgi:tetratricopeptide (TPR) repeat protein